MRLLDGKKISYESHSYEPDPTMSGEEIELLMRYEETVLVEIILHTLSEE